MAGKTLYSSRGWRRQPARAVVQENGGTVLNPIDSGILHFVNQFAQRSWLVDKAVAFVSEDPFVEGGIATTFFWWAWFRRSETKTRDRETILSGLIVAFLSLLVARGLALSLPFRARPYLDPELHFKAPLGTALYYQDLIHWSAFPSDHAVLYFALATCIYLVSWRVGLLAYIHALVFVCLPRIYLGEHYPTDILAGALLGTGMASVCLSHGVRDALSRIPLKVMHQSPTTFYTCFYTCSFLFATNFNALRKMTVYAWDFTVGLTH
jgi:undecaprenyl-diphosphatase